MMQISVQALDVYIYVASLLLKAPFLVIVILSTDIPHRLHTLFSSLSISQYDVSI
jgi:hypothetical protein